MIIVLLNLTRVKNGEGAESKNFCDERLFLAGIKLFTDFWGLFIVFVGGLSPTSLHLVASMVVFYIPYTANKIVSFWIFEYKWYIVRKIITYRHVIITKSV